MPHTQKRIQAIESSVWERELENSSRFYHVNAAWLAVFFDPIFGLTDYFNIPHAWQKIMVIRVSIAAICVVMIMLYRRYRFKSFWLVFVPFLLISLQNAYTYAFLRPENFQGHTLNYIALFIGAGLFVVWKWQYTAVVMGISAIANIYFFRANHRLSFQEAMVDGGLLLIVVAFFTFLLIEFRYSLTVKELKARLALQIANAELELQKGIIEARNKSITDSIRYASRIQSAVLGDSAAVEGHFAESFVFFKPREIVSGDFYWFSQVADGGKLLVVADCTGHGVPGAFMTVLGHTYLTDIVLGMDIVQPGEILLALDQKIVSTLRKDNTGENAVNDGMDIAIALFQNGQVHFAGAKNPLYYVRSGKIYEIKGSRFPIGSSQFKEKKRYPTHILDCQHGDVFYLFTDGFHDQFGGENNTKYMSKRFREFLLSISELPMSEQKVRLSQEFEAWKGSRNQTDDVLVAGVRYHQLA